MGKFTIGLDIGIGSVGWAAIDQEKGKLIDMGVRMFDSATPAADPRKNRSARRTLRRKKWRKDQLVAAFQDFNVIDFGINTDNNKEFQTQTKQLKDSGYFTYTIDNDDLKRPYDHTIHHLRKRALSEKVSKRELLLALYNICGTRGHFLLENIDFSRESISFDLFKERFFQLANPFVEFDDTKEEFEEKILKRIFDSKFPSRDLVNALKNNYTTNNESENALTELCKLIAGYKGDLAKIHESVVPLEGASKTSATDLAKKDDLSEYCNNIVELYDLIHVHQILSDYNYICEFNVAKLDEVIEIKKLKYNPEKKEEYDVKKKEIQSKMSGKLEERLKVIRNVENKFPNGLYVKEASAILRKQKEFYPEITEQFIEVCSSIISARIPYFIGPLSSQAKNNWVTKKGQFKYSYKWSKDNLDSVDEFDSIQKWKKAMISRCTYLPDEYALPKGSFIGETFNILNELNILTATDKNGEFYYLRTADKVKIFNELFLSGKLVTFSDVAECIGVDTFGTKSGEYKKRFNNQYTLYNSISNILPDLKIKTVEELFTNKDKINQIEDLILNINLFDEEASKKEYFIKQGMAEEKAKKIAKLKSKSFYSFSKKFLLETGMDKEGNSLVEIMFSDNTETDSHEQMGIITHAVDTDENPIHFASNKYLAKLNKESKLDDKLLIEDGKPFIPISRPVIRSLNQCFKVYEEIIKTYGVPDRVVIETARDLKDSTRMGEVPAKHFNEMKRLYDYLIKQLKEQKKKYSLIQGKMENWEEIERYLTSNKRKIELYIRQNGQDMISGDSIDIDHLENYEIDHILPRGFGDNSMDNLMLIHKSYNSKKADRTPLEYIESDGVTSKKNGAIISSKDYISRCHKLHELRMISEKKLKQLLLPDTEEAMGFINRNLVDTRYIIREFMAVLKAYNQVKEYDTHVVALQSAFTTVYKNAFNIRKNRDIGDQHHALDAATVAIADKVLSTYYPNYDQRGNQKAYGAFLNEVRAYMEGDNTEHQKLNSFINYAYKKAFGDYPNDNTSLVSEIKNTCPLYSIRENKNYKGEFFNASIYSPVKEGGKLPPLTVLGVNNKTRSFSSVNCVAVDFYKYTDKKGNKKHVGIHIPKVIVDNDGNINKEQYIKLIKEFYETPELLDDNDELKLFNFRFRAFVNDLVYDTKNQTIQKFNIGSIAKKLLQLNHIYIFSYNEIYKQYFFYRNEISKQFDFKLARINPNGTKKYSDYKNVEIVDYLIDNLMSLDEIALSKRKKDLRNILLKVNGFNELLETASFYNLIINRNCTPPSIVGQYTPSANSSDFKGYEDTEYVKIKSSPLGIRYTYNEKGNLQISGPKRREGAFTKIKREKFSWKIV